MHHSEPVENPPPPNAGSGSNLAGEGWWVRQGLDWLAPTSCDARARKPDASVRSNWPRPHLPYRGARRPTDATLNPEEKTACRWRSWPATGSPADDGAASANLPVRRPMDLGNPVAHPATPSDRYGRSASGYRSRSTVTAPLGVEHDQWCAAAMFVRPEEAGIYRRRPCVELVRLPKGYLKRCFVSSC